MLNECLLCGGGIHESHSSAFKARQEGARMDLPVGSHLTGRKPFTNIDVMSSSDTSKTDGCVPPKSVDRNDLLGLKIERLFGC